ncbi:NUDIX hydrolase [Maribacter ulvicola]|uniref:8-oxo-dGTP diphosphatase n=1 Tax=Maribacter ulvicola TaxID=228959 RepID=A0A1N6Y9W8_9FLAO|nr:NUDIX domain-containing protein [Maribacter ulvicola]SIR11306.1 8-oxo-dGTP diphosphatase [Maribacter ulvicola]
MTVRPISPTIKESSYECSMTVDCAVFGFHENQLKILLVKRSIQPFKNRWLLPGGIMEEGQTLVESVDFVLHQLTGITNLHKQQVKTYSDVNRHPTKRVVTVCYYALVKPENHPVIPKNHISEVKWHAINESLPKLAFDHSTLLNDALDALKSNLRDKLIFGELLPEMFTLKELQDLYENILGEELDRRNFRRKIHQMNLLELTGNKKIGVQGGPSLYRLK